MYVGGISRKQILFTNLYIMIYNGIVYSKSYQYVPYRLCYVVFKQMLKYFIV
mgnify:CR=1 FL=1